MKVTGSGDSNSYGVLPKEAKDARVKKDGPVVRGAPANLEHDTKRTDSALFPKEGVREPEIQTK